MNMQTYEILVQEFNSVLHKHSVLQTEFWNYYHLISEDKEYIELMKNNLIKLKKDYQAAFDSLKAYLIKSGPDYYTHFDWCTDYIIVLTPFIIIEENNQIGLKDKSASVYRNVY